MEITIAMIEQVLDATDADYRLVKQALVDADGDVDAAIQAVKASQAAEAEKAADAEEAAKEAGENAAKDAEAVDAETGGEPADRAAVDAEATAGSDDDEDEEDVEADHDPDWTSDEFADNMIDRLKKRVQEGNVDQIRISRDGKTIISIPVNVGIIGGLIGIAAIPWAVILGAIAAYGLNCKVEVITKDGESEEM